MIAKYVSLLQIFVANVPLYTNLEISQMFGTVMATILMVYFSELRCSVLPIHVLWIMGKK